jgi:DNA polymerase III delta subunit
MDLTTLKSHIKNKTFDDYYIFTGPEIAVMRIYLNQIAKVLGATVKSLDSLEMLSQKLTNKTMLKNACIYTLRDSKDFILDDKINAKITQNFASYDMPVVLLYTSIDKRSKVYKNSQDHIVEFDYLPESVLVKYIQKEIDLSESNCKKLIEVCESDYSRIMLEIDKILQYAKYEDNSSLDLIFTKLLKNGTIYSPPRDAVFMFVDAVLKNKPRLAFELLEESYESGEATMILLSNLYNSAKQLLQVQSYQGDGKITEATGLTPFQVKLASGRKHIYSNGDLIYLMRLTRDAEKGIKTGEIEETMAVPYILVNFFGGSNYV